MSSLRVTGDYIATPIPLVGMTAEALDSLLYRYETVGSQEADSGSRASNREWRTGNQRTPTLPPFSQRQPVFRQYLSEEEGEGYWEFQRLSDDLAISWTKAVYVRDTWIDVPGPSAAFKIRLLSNGELSHPDSQLHMRGPASMLSVYPAHTNNGYIVRGGIDTEFVVLHCRPSLLKRYLDALAQDLPLPFRGWDQPCGRSVSQFMSSMPNVQGTIRDLFYSRHRYSPAIQHLYLESKIQEILCNAVQALLNQHAESGTKTSSQMPDVRQVREAQRILLQELASPPHIEALARHVTLSQTKLKADFRAVTGETIYTFVKRSRMERAEQLLLEGNATVSEVAYAVGYQYVGNFSAVFRQHFGISPRKWLLLHSNDS